MSFLFDVTSWYRDRTLHSRWTILLGVLCVCIGSLAYGQPVDNVGARLERQLREAERLYTLQPSRGLTLNERVMIDVGAIANFTFLAVDDVDQRTRILRQYGLQLYGAVNVDGIHQFFGRVRFTYRDFNEGDSFDGNGDSWVYPIGDRYWYQFDLGRAYEASQGERLGGTVRVRMGRQYVNWGSGMVLSEEMYALHGDVVVDDWFTVTTLFGLTTPETVIDFDPSRPDYDTSTERFFTGVQVTLSAIPNHRPYFFFLNQEDLNGDDATVFNIGGTLYPTEFDYNSQYFGIGSNGQIFPWWIYHVEAVYQRGETLSNSFDPVTFLPVTQTRDPIEAWAVKAQFDFLVLDANQTQFQVEALFASGDDDRSTDTSATLGGNAPDSVDRAFNAFGYSNTGLAFAAPVSNLMMFRLGASTYPLRNHATFERMQLGIDTFWFMKLNSDAPIDEATNNNRYLGFETDLYMNWRITSDLSLNMRYGVYFPGDSIAVDKDARHFFLTGITLAF